MTFYPLLLDWTELALRWLHLIAGIAWIGSSFYFMALDASLRKRDGLPKGVHGEAWQVHGGGFYRMQKYNVAPPELPEELTWFKWEAYTTWISGFFLLVVMYYFGAELYMIDPETADIGAWTASAIGIATIVLGWVVYDQICKSRLGEDQRVLGAIGLIAFTLLCLLLNQFLSRRGAFLHTGALIGTIMVANVAHIIIPNQRKVVAALKAGETPDPALGLQAKQRSVHNNYLTLPVLFVMISNHYSLTFASRFNWLILGLSLIVGAAIRHFFNLRHEGKSSPWWTWGVAALGGIAIAWLASFPATPPAEAAGKDDPALELAEVQNVILGRCSMCHAEKPLWPGIPYPPKNVVLETPEDMARHAFAIHNQTVRTHAMPPGNITFIEEEERRLLDRWYRAGAPVADEPS